MATLYRLPRGLQWQQLALALNLAGFLLRAFMGRDDADWKYSSYFRDGFWISRWPLGM